MKIQTLYKRLPLPLLLTVIFATGIGVTPARSASLVTQGTVIAQGKPMCDPPRIVPPNCERGHPRRVAEPIDPKLQQQGEQQQRELARQQGELDRQRQQQRELDRQLTVEPLPQNQQQ